MSLSPINSNWRGDPNEYYKLVDIGFQELLADKRMMVNLEKLYPDADIEKSIEKSVLQMWGIEKGWLYKKHSQVRRINMKQTLFDTIQYSLVTKSAFASRKSCDTQRDAKPVIEPSEERRNIHLQNLATEIGAALWKLSNRKELTDEYLRGLETATVDGTEDEYLEKFHAKLKSDHPEAFKIEPENSFFLLAQAQMKISNEDKQRAAQLFKERVL